MCEYSVALCTYNGECYIADQLKSILNQSITPAEIIISDDGSVDQTLKIASEILSASNVEYKIVENRNCHGVAKNFLNAISLCKSDYIFTSDQDDVWINRKAETMLRIFSENERALLVFSNGSLVNQDLSSMNCDMWKCVGITEKMLEEQKWFAYLLKSCVVTGAAMAFKKELFEPGGDIPKYWLHDGWLAWKAAAEDGLVPCPEKLILYRQHGNNVVGMSGKSVIQKVRGYLNLFRENHSTHIERYVRYQEVMDNLGNQFSNNQQKELNECIAFWRDLFQNDSEASKMRALKCIWEHYKGSDYARFYNGSKGMIRDMVCVFFKGDA